LPVKEHWQNKGQLHVSSTVMFTDQSVPSDAGL
jgi:hypothetical protein